MFHSIAKNSFVSFDLFQCQSLVVGFMSASGAILVILLVRQEFIFSHNILLLASSLCTAAIASSVLGMIHLDEILY